MGALFSRSSTPRTSFDPATDIPDLIGKVAIITGGNSGLGYAIVQHLARKGAKVYLAARSRERALVAIERLHAEGLGPGNGPVEWLDLDLSFPRKVKQCGEEFASRETRLDMLVHNAGVMRVPYRLGPEGIQDNMLVNHIGPFVLTRALLPLLVKTAQDPQNDVRIVTMSSCYIFKMDEQPEVRFRSIDDFNRFQTETFFTDGRLFRYVQSKLANVLYAKQLQKRLTHAYPSAPITVLATDPGYVATEGVRKDPLNRIPIVGRLYQLVQYLFFASPAVGAWSTVFAAAAPAVKRERERYMGAYIVPPGRIGKPPSRHAEDPALAEELWETTEAILKSLDI